VVAAAGSSVVWIAAGAVGDDIALTVTRDGAERSLTATLGTQPAGATGG
jgi:S1-C subfamily serine protease